MPESDSWAILRFLFRQLLWLGRFLLPAHIKKESIDEMKHAGAD
jgi:hypothetical protein